MVYPQTGRINPIPSKFTIQIRQDMEDTVNPTNNPQDEDGAVDAATDPTGDGATAGPDSGPGDTEPDSDTTDDSARVYPADYVQRLRRDVANYRTRASDAEQRLTELSEALWTARVSELGLLADPADLPFDPELVDDVDAIRAAAEALVAAKPHLRSQRITARIGQGEPDTAPPPASLVGLLRAGA